ncbi:MAG: 2-hydroxyacyl-CoA dehydratase [Tissierellia bacterium]|nr:2-hydroxyacyl-CoA dehydratase [Tissierellia bacterium]
MSNVERLFNEFGEVAKHPGKAIKGLVDKTGKKVIGCVPLYTPKELIYAAGMLPVGVWGAEKEVSEAKRYFPAFLCSIMQTILDEGLVGNYDILDAIIIPNYCDSLKVMGQNFKLAVKNVKFLPLTIPQTRRIPAGKTFIISQYNVLKEQLEEIAGKKITDEALNEAIEVFNEQNKTMMEFSKLCAEYPAEINAMNRMYVYKSAYFMEVPEHTAMVKELIAEIRKEAPKAFNGHRVVTTGIIVDSANLNQILVDLNCAVVGDDVAFESRQYRHFIPEGDSPMDRIGQQFCDRECSTLLNEKRIRGQMIIDLAKERNAEGIIFFLTKFCDPEEFDYPKMKADFEAAGVPHIMVEIDQQIRNLEQARTYIQTFTDVL